MHLDTDFSKFGALKNFPSPHYSKCSPWDQQHSESLLEMQNLTVTNKIEGNSGPGYTRVHE